MLGPSCCSTAQDFCAIPFMSAAGIAAAFGISRSMMYFGIWSCPVSCGISVVGHRGKCGSVPARNPRIPVGENAARVFLPHPRVESLQLEHVVLLELLAE